MDSTYQRAMNANVTPQIFSTMVSNAQKVAEAFAGSGSATVDAESIAAVFSRMVVAQIEMFEKKSRSLHKICNGRGRPKGRPLPFTHCTFCSLPLLQTEPAKTASKTDDY